jgi:hypothetical protein
MPPKWSNRFEVKPGRWVFVPTPESRKYGLEIKKSIEKKWSPPNYYFHLKNGGHVAAVRAHLGNSNFLHLDIQDFFGSINRTRVTRALTKLVGYKLARRWAIDSTVLHPNDGKRSIVPYGFVQSPLICSVSLRDSALGRYLHRISTKSELAVSIYVDDVIISTREVDLIEKVEGELKGAARRARFGLSSKKSHGPATEINAFNILVSRGSMAISPERMAAFSHALAQGPSDARRRGILAYIASICPSQAATVDGSN